MAVLKGGSVVESYDNDGAKERGTILSSGDEFVCVCERERERDRGIHLQI